MSTGFSAREASKLIWTGSVGFATTSSRCGVSWTAGSWLNGRDLFNVGLKLESFCVAGTISEFITHAHFLILFLSFCFSLTTSLSHYVSLSLPLSITQSLVNTSSPPLSSLNLQFLHLHSQDFKWGEHLLEAFLWEGALEGESVGEGEHLPGANLINIFSEQVTLP